MEANTHVPIFGFCIVTTCYAFLFSQGKSGYKGEKVLILVRIDAYIFVVIYYI